MLDLVPPIFKGRMLPSAIPNVQRWEIEIEILSRPTGIPIAPIVYRKVYTSWEMGLMMAKQEALSCICEEYHQLLPPGSLHRFFGRRGATGLPHWSGNDRKDMTLMALQFEDLEVTIHRAVTLLDVESRVVDQSKELIAEQKKRIATVEGVIVSQEAKKEKLETTNQKLEAENLKLLNKVDTQEAMIVALREQCAQLTKESTMESSSVKRHKTSTTVPLKQIKDE